MTRFFCHSKSLDNSPSEALIFSETVEEELVALNLSDWYQGASKKRTKRRIDQAAYCLDLLEEIEMEVITTASTSTVTTPDILFYC